MTDKLVLIFSKNPDVGNLWQFTIMIRGYRVLHTCSEAMFGLHLFGDNPDAVMIIDGGQDETTKKLCREATKHGIKSLVLRHAKEERPEFPADVVLVLGRDGQDDVFNSIKNLVAKNG